MDNNDLSDLELKTILHSSYGIIVDKIDKVRNSSTDCYIITCGNKKYFVKVFNRHKNISKIEQENHILMNLKRYGFNVPSIIKNNEEKTYTFYRDHYLFLESYIEGYSYAEADIPNNILLKSSKILGKMHRVLNNQYDDERKRVFWEELDIENETRFLDSVLDMIRIEPEDDNYQIIIDAINHKKQMLKELKRMNSMFGGITYLMTHGDYSKRNLLWDKDNDIVVVDFSDSGVYPASWELIRSYFFSTESCKNNKSFDEELFSEYIARYFSEFKLNDRDIELMPYLFAYQILLSRYGYREYIQSRDDKLIEFIKWKENISHYLEENADVMVKRLKI